MHILLKCGNYDLFGTGDFFIRTASLKTQISLVLNIVNKNPALYLKQGMFHNDAKRYTKGTPGATPAGGEEWCVERELPVQGL